MTVREFIQKLLLESPSLDATVYISEVTDDGLIDFEITRIDNDGMFNGINIDLKREG
jgi:phosphoribosylformimino-5-aminoimidazole carboxamide ribonucleotide (ProFAR) isomerase